MRLRCRGVAERGHPDERLVFSVHQDADVGDYVVMRTGHDGEDVTTDVKNAFWFPYGLAKAGDLVVLYSRRGRTNKVDHTERSVHFYYWGQDESLWESDQAVPVLLFAPEWDSVLPENLEFKMTQHLLS